MLHTQRALSTEKEAPWRCQMTHGTRSLARQKDVSHARNKQFIIDGVAPLLHNTQKASLCWLETLLVIMSSSRYV
jgi:hypothetical protein